MATGASPGKQEGWEGIGKKVAIAHKETAFISLTTLSPS